MRKLISVLAALALVGSLAAQKGKKAAAKAPKGPAIPAVPKAPAIPAVPAAAAAAKSEGGSKFIINAWGGYAINGRTDFVKGVDTWGDNLASVSGYSSKATDENVKGVAAGLDLWYGDKFQFGVGGSYHAGFKTTKTVTFTGSQAGTAANTTQLNYIPILLQARFFIVEGLYAGVGAGIALINNGKTDGGITGSLVNANYPYSTSYTGNALWFEGRLGYRLAITDLFGLDLFGAVAYQSGTVQFQSVDNSGNPIAATELKNSGVNITPALALSLKF